MTPAPLDAPGRDDPPLPAVMVFLRLPEAGRVKTRLAATLGAQAATRIYDALAQGVVRRLAGPPLWRLEIHVTGGADPVSGEATSASSLLADASRWLAPAIAAGTDSSPLAPPPPRFVPQCRGDLGMRMESALRGAFARGAPAACIVASDVPELGPGPVARALGVLSPRVAPASPSVVFGPSPDGGYYLVGLTPQAMEPALPLFRDMRWSTPEVLAESLARAARAGLVVHLLEPLGDVDRAEDLHRLEGLPPQGSPLYPPVSPQPPGRERPDAHAPYAPSGMEGADPAP